MQNRKNQLILFLLLVLFLNSDIAFSTYQYKIFPLWFKSVIVYFIDKRRLFSQSKFKFSYFYISVCISATHEEYCFFLSKAKRTKQ